MQRNQLVLIKPKSNATIATRQAILLESVEPREIKIVGGEMLRTLAIRMGEDLTSHSEEEEDYALMACNSSGSDTEREQLSDASIEIKAYTQGLKKVEAQLVAHQQGQLWRNACVYPTLTGTYMAIGPGVEIDYSQFNILTLNRNSSQREKRAIWNNVQRVNKQNQFAHSPFSRPFNKTTTLRTNFSKQKVNTAKVNTVSVVGGKRETTVKPSAGCKWRPQRHNWHNVSKYNGGSGLRNCSTFKDPLDYPHRALQNKGIVDSGCSRHITGNKAYLAEYQDFNGGLVAFGGSKGYITGKEGLACLIAKATIDKSNKWHRRLGHVNFKNLNKLVKGNLVRCLPSKIFKMTTLVLLVRKESNTRPPVRPNQSKGIKREYSNARTLQQNEVAERKNRTLIEAARTMLADSFLPNTFWAEAVSTACYVLNRVLVTKPHNKGLITDHPYELVKLFDGKSDEGFLVGYSLQSKAFRVYNLETKRVEENLHITFLENKPNVAGKGPTWLFDLDYLTDSMNYQPVRSENQANKHAGPQEANQNAGTEDVNDADDSEKEAESAQDYFVLPIWSSYSSTVKRSTAKDAGEAPNKHPDLQIDEKPVDKEDQVFLDELERLKRQEQDANDAAEALRKEFAQETEELLLQAGGAKSSSTNIVNTASTSVSTASPYGGLSFTYLTNPKTDDSEIHTLEDIYNIPTDGIFTNSSYDDEGAVADFTNLEPVVNVSPIPTSRINSIHPSTLILGDPHSAVQTRSKVTKSSGAHAFVSYIQKQRRNNHKDFQQCLFACFLSQNEPKKISEALENESWVDVIQEELLQFKIQKVWILVDLPYEKKQLEQNRFTETRRMREESWIEAIRIFLAFASYMGFIVYQMDVKSAFLYGKINEEVYVSQSPDDIIFGSTKKSWCDKFEALMKSRFQMSSMGELTFFLGLQVKQKEDGIFISQDKYVAEILKKFDFVSVKTASTPIETQKPLVKDEEASDVDVHLYRSMIGSLMYLTASRPDIMFAVCACSRFQVTPKTSHLSAVKRIFRYLKGKPKLGLWYPRVSSFDLEAYSDSDYAGANLDRKSTTGGCQFLGRRLISWQCKKQTIVATSTTEAEYVAAANCCGQVLWIQNQMLDYGFNFMNTKIYIDNESTLFAL
ncbi:putative ribonuclease H-like domain-containing protein [Tanacetum coccineum]